MEPSFRAWQPAETAEVQEIVIELWHQGKTGVMRPRQAEDNVLLGTARLKIGDLTTSLVICRASPGLRIQSQVCREPPLHAQAC